MESGSTIASFGSQYSSTQEQQVDFVFLLLDRPACLIHTLQTRGITFDKADLPVGVNLTELLYDLGGLCLISPNKVDSRRKRISHKCPGGCLADPTGSTDLKLPCQRVTINRCRLAIRLR